MLVFAGLIGLQLAAGLTAYRYQTFHSGMLYCAYGLLCFLLVQCLHRTAQIKRLVISLSAYGFALAMFAVIQSLATNGKLYWIRAPVQGGWIYGPYLNHNHYAGLMEMLVPVPLVFSLTRFARGPRRTLAALAAALMSSTILLSGSRGGMAAFAIQMALLVAILFKKQAPGKTTVVLGIFLGLVIGLLAWLGGGELTRRIASIRAETHVELSGGMRLNIDRDALKMAAHQPVLGWGLGVFPDIYPQYRSFYTHFFVNAAHNDYLQLLVEMGALGFLTMLWFVVVLYSRALRKIGNWHTDINGAVALAAMLGVTGILVHSLVDFNLQIPANAALFYVLCVLAAMEPRFGLTRHKPAHRREIVSQVSA
jgi:O-antigen ligase